jgi:exo-beta-1,3-glucanase (GH17 family)
MSVRKDKIMALAGENLANKTSKELKSLFSEVLEKGMHGLGFSPYLENQKPGDIITEDQIRRRIEIIKPYTKWIRSFSCTDGNEHIPRIAHEYGIKTLVGAWLGTDDKINKKEIENVIKIAKEGYADIVAVGNEVMYRGDLSEEELIAHIKSVKEALPGIPVGYVDAYYEFEKRPNITEVCDVILANCYPFWEGCHIDYSLVYMKDMYHRAKRAGEGKKVIISEAGWPSKGQTFYGAQPSFENAVRYFINTQLWSKEEDIDIFYFSSFDEPWKIGAEGDVGAYWGLWDKNEKLKY